MVVMEKFKIGLRIEHPNGSQRISERYETAKGVKEWESQLNKVQSNGFILRAVYYID